MAKQLLLLQNSMEYQNQLYNYDRVTGRVTHGRKPRPNPYLTKTEETELSKFLIVTSKAVDMEKHE